MMEKSVDFLAAMVERWAETVNSAGIGVECVEQGWGRLCFGTDARHGTLRSGGREFFHGFGTHANSRIRVTSAKPLARFRGFGGAAQNDFTKQHMDTVSGLIFALEAGGGTVAESGLTHYGELAEFDVDLGGTTAFDLTVQAPAGTGFAHANWCATELETVDGERFSCGVPAVEFPVAFHYDGESSADFFARYGVCHTQKAEADHQLHIFVSESETLRMTLTCKVYRDYPVLEWQPVFENPSVRRSERLSGVDSLRFIHGQVGASLRFLRRRGSFHWEQGTFSADDFRDSFRPVEELPNAGESWHFGGTAGRPSVEWLPCFDLTDGDLNWRFAVGWAGQWRADAAFDGAFFRIAAGIGEFDAVLEPGERLELPSILLQRSTDGPENAVNLWRRFVSAKIMMPLDGAPPVAPLSYMTWGGMGEARQLEKLSLIERERLPLDVYWIDAGWFARESRNEFEPTWAENVGDWKFDPQAFPEELRNVSAEVHRQGGKLLLWFEPERVRTHCNLAREHPEYLIFNCSQDALFNLGDPAAWRYCFDMLSRIISENRIDWLRQDFNFSPLPYWRSKDAPDRRGVTEIRYVAGLYRLWRELRRNFPHLMIDNCASGGRRLDFESLRYSLPLWFSDMYCFPGFEPRYSLTHLAGMANYWPRFGGGVQNPEGGDTYRCRASMSSGFGIHCYYNADFDPEHYPWQWLRERLDEFREIQDCFSGDFYCLAEPSMTDANWAVMQYDLPEEKRGVITVFRGEACPETARLLMPRGLNPEAKYRVSDRDGVFSAFVVTGAQWMKTGLPLQIGLPRTARLITYAVADENTVCGDSI